MAEGDTHFDVSATLRLKKTKFEKDARRAAKSITPLERSMKRAAAGALVVQHNMAQFARKQKLAQKASEQAERAARQAERAATRLAEKRSREMARLTRQARKAEMAMSRLQRKSIGRGLGTAKGMMAPRGAAAMGGMGRVAGQGAMIGGAAATLGLGAAMVHGLRFNKTMADTKNSVATMFQMFDVGKAYLAPGATGVDIFRTNIGLAHEAVDELLVRQAETPAGFTQVAAVFSQGIAGLAKGTKDVSRMLDLTTQISKLGPALNNDYGQLGRDTMRILSGSAEQEVQVWRLLKGEFFQLAKATKGMLPKGMKDGEDFVKFFNKSLSAAQRMDLFEQAMSKLGPEFEGLFKASMSGLLAATSSKLSMITGALTQPLYKSFKDFLGRINFGDGLLAGNMTQRWMGVAGYFGKILGDSATNLFLAFERGAMFVDQHWSAVTDSIIRAFQVGGLIIQAYIAKALATMIAAPAMMAGGAALGGAKGLFKFFGKVSKRREKMGGKGLVGSMASMADFTKYLKLVGIMAAPTVVAFVAMAAALAVIGFAAAAVAVYIVKNWDKLVKSILDRWNEVGPVFERVYLKARYLFDMMSLVGEALLGSATGASAFITLLGLMEEALYFAAGAVIFMTKTLSMLNSLRQPGHQLEAAQKKAQAETSLAMLSAAQQSGADPEKIASLQARHTRAIDEQIEAEGARDANADRSHRLDQAALKMEMAVKRGPDKVRQRAATAALAKLREGLVGTTEAGKGKKVPKGGVHITNQYNQWDLRNTDPDRIMSAFIPKLESLADKRTQSYEQTEQGV